MAMNVIIIDDANDRKGSEMNTTMSLVLDLKHCDINKNRKAKNDICQTSMPSTVRVPYCLTRRGYPALALGNFD